METILYINTLAALIGAYLNAKGKWYGFAIWIVTNAIFVWHNMMIGQTHQSCLFGAYLGISIVGLQNSLKKETNV